MNKTLKRVYMCVLSKITRAIRICKRITHSNNTFRRYVAAPSTKKGDLGAAMRTSQLVILVFTACIVLLPKVGAHSEQDMFIL